MIKHIRPYQLFQKLNEPPGERIAQIMLPRRRYAGGTSLLETALLITAARIVKARTIFEFGTFFGTNTLNLALNIPDDGKVYTLDLEDPTGVLHASDLPLTIQHLSAGMDFEGTEAEKKICRLVGNSREFAFSRFHDAIDMVFIDGGHDWETVQSDTKSAWRMIKPKSPFVFAWHDYGNPDYPELTKYLDEWPPWDELIHVEDTMLCFWFSPALDFA